MKIIHIDVINKKAVAWTRDGAIVCGNSDYKVAFTFDSEWDGINDKTARFVWGGQYYDVPFTGTECTAPIIMDADKVEVGIYAGALRTTTGAVVPCTRSILSGGTIARPEFGGNYTAEAKAAAQAAKASEEAAAESAAVAQASADTAVALLGGAESLTTVVVNHEKRIRNIEQGLTPDPFVTDAESAHEKVVPANACPYAAIERIGGMTHKSDNLLPFPYPDASKTQNGITWTVNADGTITANGTATAGVSFTLYNGRNFCSGGKTYSLSGLTSQGSRNSFFLAVQLTGADGSYISGANVFEGQKTFVNVPDAARIVVYIYIEQGTTVNNIVFKPMLNEGDEALPYTPYFAGLREAKVTAVESLGAQLLPFPYKETNKTQAGVTFKVQSDGGVALSGTPTEYVQFNLTENLDIRAFPKVFTVSLQGGVNVGIDMALKDDNYDVIYSVGIIPGQSATIDLSNYPTATKFTSQIKRYNSNVAVGGVAYPMINRGTSAAPYKPYRAGAVDTFQLSEKLLQFIEQRGYGRGVHDYYGYIDLTSGRFVPPPTYRKVFDGTEDWMAYGSGVEGKHRMLLLLDAINAPTAKYFGSGYLSPIISTHYESIIPNDVYRANRGVTCADDYIAYYDPAFDTSDVTLWKAHLAELAAAGTPITVEYAVESEGGAGIAYDISEYLTYDNFIEVEGGGALKAVDKHNLAAPTTITYQLKGGTT